MGEAGKEGKYKGGSGYQDGDGLEEKGSDKLLSAAWRNGYWEGVGKEDRADGGHWPC